MFARNYKSYLGIGAVHSRPSEYRRMSLLLEDGTKSGEPALKTAGCFVSVLSVIEFVRGCKSPCADRVATEGSEDLQIKKMNGQLGSTWRRAF